MNLILGLRLCRPQKSVESVQVKEGAQKTDDRSRSVRFLGRIPLLVRSRRLTLPSRMNDKIAKMSNHNNFPLEIVRLYYISSSLSRACVRALVRARGRYGKQNKTTIAQSKHNYKLYDYLCRRTLKQ